MSFGKMGGLQSSRSLFRFICGILPKSKCSKDRPSIRRQHKCKRLNGNRPTQTVTAGSGPSNSVTTDPATNRITGAPYSHDLSGNICTGCEKYGVATRVEEWRDVKIHFDVGNAPKGPF